MMTRIHGAGLGPPGKMVSPCLQPW